MLSSGGGVPATPPPLAQAPPPGSYAVPPGAVMVAPGQVYPPYTYPPRGPYGPMLVGPPPVVLTPAPPMTSYEWSATLEALFLERSVGSSIPLGYTVYNSVPNMPVDGLYTDDVPFPLAPGLRLELSRKLGADLTISATYWGFQQWSVSDVIYGNPNQRAVVAFSPYIQLPMLLGGLDDSLSYTYKSQVQNVEVNAMRSLSATDYSQLDVLLGLRYVYFADQFTMTGIDDTNVASEQLDYSTTNNLLGVQTGLRFVRGWERFQWEAGLKFGLMANLYHQRVIDSATGASGFVPYDIPNDGTGLSVLTEISLAARVRLSDLLWLRLGYQFYDFTGMALAPRQLGGFGHGGNVALDGLSIGLQATW
jgi:hypothetical protein